MSSELKHYKLGELCQVKHGWPFQGEYFSDEGEYIVLTPANFYEEGGFKRVVGKEKFYLGEFPKEYLCSKGDLVVAMTQQAEGLLGSTAIVPEDNIYLHNQRIGLITHNEELVDKQYLYYLFMTAGVRKQIRNSASGTKVKHTSPEKIYDVDVYIPCLCEQRKIAKYLQNLESKITNNTALALKLEQITTLLFNYWFVQFEFPNEKGKPYKSSGGEMVWCEELKRDIPKGWSYGELKDIANITMGQSPDGSSYNDSGEGMVFYQGKTDFGMRFPTPRMYTTSPTRFAKKGDILLSVRAPVGALNVAMEDCCIGRGLAALNSKSKSDTYLFSVLSNLQERFELYNGTGTTFGSITKENLFEMPVTLPHSKVITMFEDRVCRLNQRIFLLEEENRKIGVHKDWLLPLLMNGQATIE